MLISQEQGKPLVKMARALWGAHMTARKTLYASTHDKVISIHYEALPIGSLSEQQLRMYHSNRTCK